MTTLDRRLNAYRGDLADSRLRGKVAAARFVDGEAARLAVPVADVFAHPFASGGIQTQVLFGHKLQVFEHKQGWAFVQNTGDGYVGYVESRTLGTDMVEPTHRVVVPRTFVYPLDDLKVPPHICLSMGSLVAIADQTARRGTHYSLLANGGAIISRHLKPVHEHTDDPVSIAEKLVRTPYLWGGASAFGIDCSGLVALAHFMAGTPVLRDSDMQAASIGAEFSPDADYSNLQRGDLVFWKGHVGLMQDETHLIHANGHTMDVAVEPLRAAIDRIGYLYGAPIMVRRA